MNVYGPRQNNKGVYISVILKMLNALDAGEDVVVHGDGSQSYDFVDVRDCARANVLAMQSDVTGSFYNVGTGVKISIAEMAKKIIATYQNEGTVQFKDATRPYVKNRIGATVNAACDLGFEAAYQLDDGLKNLYQWRNQ